MVSHYHWALEGYSGTAGGKNIAPRRIESKVDGELIHHCIVVGSEQPYWCFDSLDDEFLMNGCRE